MPEVLSYEPTDYDAEDIPPDAPAGAWQAQCVVKANKTQENLPRLIVEWTLLAAYDEANEGFVGQQVSDMITLKPGIDNIAKMNKLQLKAFCERIGVSRQLIPKHIQNSTDLEEFISACANQVCDIYTSVKVNPTTGESRTRCHYTAPKQSLTNGVMGGVAPEALETADAGAVEGDPEAEPEEAAFTGDEPEAVAEEQPEPEPTPEPARRGRKPREPAAQAQQSLPTAAPAPAAHTAAPAPATRQPAPATRPAPAPAAVARPAAMAPAPAATNGAVRRPIAAAQQQRRA